MTGIVKFIRGEGGFALPRFAAVVTALAVGLFGALASDVVEGPPAALGDGAGSPTACQTPYNDSTAPFTWTAPSGWIITGVCIKAGQPHSGVYTSNGNVGSPFADNCYSISGIGTQSLTVTKIGSGPTCQDISHIDVVKARVFYIKKVIDLDGNTSTTGDQITSGADVNGWSYSLANVQGGTASCTSYVTDASGSAGPCYFTNSDGGPDELDILETEKSGYDFFAAACTAGADFDLDTSGGQVGVRDLEMSNTGTLTCTFYNKPTKGKIIVDKVTVPSGSTQSFEFDPSWSGSNFTLTDGATPIASGLLSPGTYSVAEVNIPAGWQQTSATCSSQGGDGDAGTPGAIDLDAGETVTCTFTNLQLGKIIVCKDASPADSVQEFSFTSTWGSFSLSNGECEEQDKLQPREYSVTETVPADWELVGIQCIGGNFIPNGSSVSIDLGPGDEVTCTFSNVGDPGLDLDKLQSLNGGPFVFWTLEDVEDGDTIQYRITLENNGLQPLTNWTITDTLPGELSGATEDSPDCSIAGGVLTCSGPTLNPGDDPFTVTVTGTVAGLDCEDEFRNTARVSATVGGQGPDAGQVLNRQSNTVRARGEECTPTPTPTPTSTPPAATPTPTATPQATVAAVTVVQSLPASGSGGGAGGSSAGLGLWLAAAGSLLAGLGLAVWARRLRRS